MNEEQRWKETLLWREGGEEGGREGEREGVAEGARLSSSVFPEVRSAGGEKIKAETLAFEVRQR